MLERGVAKKLRCVTLSPMQSTPAQSPMGRMGDPRWPRGFPHNSLWKPRGYAQVLVWAVQALVLILPFPPLPRRTFCRRRSTTQW